MNSEHFAIRLKSARIMNGFSLQDLADKLNDMHVTISRQALHKYEKGEIKPDSEMMGYLCNALGIRPDYFYQSVVELGKVEFRKLKEFSAKEKSMIEEQTKDILSRYFEIEGILGIENTFDNPIKDIQINTLDDVEKASTLLREKWKLGTDALFNIVELLEDNGIRIIEIDEDPAFSGMQTWAYGNIPVIVLNKNKEIPLDRKRFTAIHELGHLLLKDINHLPEKDKERFCHYFAGAMLFPEEVVKSEIGGNRNRLLIHELGVIKQQYGISIQAIVYRLRDLGYVSENYLKQFMFMMNQLGIRIQEPSKYDYQGVEKSNRFDQLIFRALGENLITMSKAASLKNQKLADFRAENMLI